MGSRCTRCRNGLDTELEEEGFGPGPAVPHPLYTRRGGPPANPRGLPVSGTWRRRGSSIVLDWSDTENETLEGEFETVPQTIRRGSRGESVSQLQSKLAALGFDPGPIDGVFGPNTDAAVRGFQASRRLTVDGIVGPQTWSALESGSGVPARSWPSLPSTPSPTMPAPSRGGSAGDLHVVVPFYGYQSNDKDGCFRRCTEMAAAVGVTVGGPDVRIQVALREDLSGRVTIDPDAARAGIDYMGQQLAARRPVCVGVSYTDASYNVDDITDHFVLVTTRGVDPAMGVYFAFHDPASSHESIGGDANQANRFFATQAGGLYRPASSSAPLGSHIYDVSMVRRNV